MEWNNAESQIDFSSLLEQDPSLYMNPREDVSFWLETELPPAQGYEQLSVMPDNWIEVPFIKPDPEEVLLSSDEQQLEAVSPMDHTPTRTPTKREVKKPSKSGRRKSQKAAREDAEEKYQKRLLANKLSAQQSRERKKQLKTELESQLSHLTAENSQLSNEMTQLETENKVLKNEFVQLQTLISQSPIFSKMFAQQVSMNLPSVEQMQSKKLQALSNQGQSTEKQTPSLFAPSPSTDPTSLMYLFIILQSFNQYFTMNNLKAENSPAPFHPVEVV